LNFYEDLIVVAQKKVAGERDELLISEHLDSFSPFDVLSLSDDKQVDVPDC